MSTTCIEIEQQGAVRRLWTNRLGRTPNGMFPLEIL